MTLDWFRVVTMRVTRDGSDPHTSSTGVILRDHFDNFRAMFDNDRKALNRLKSCGWHDYQGNTISVNQWLKTVSYPDNSGVIAWKELGY